MRAQILMKESAKTPHGPDGLSRRPTTARTRVRPISRVLNRVDINAYNEVMDALGLSYRVIT